MSRTGARGRWRARRARPLRRLERRDRAGALVHDGAAVDRRGGPPRADRLSPAGFARAARISIRGRFRSRVRKGRRGPLQPGRAPVGPGGRDVKSLHLAGIADGEVLTGPQTIHLDITNGCNTNCITCWDHSPLLKIGRSSAWRSGSAWTSKPVERVLDDAMSLGGLQAVIVSGMGEPFTHPKVYAILRAVKARRLHCTVITRTYSSRRARRRFWRSGSISSSSASTARPGAPHLALPPEFFGRRNGEGFPRRCSRRFRDAGRRFKRRPRW